MLTPAGATSIHQTCSAGTAPVAAGGVVQDGRYVLMASTKYGAGCVAPSSAYSAVMNVCGDVWQQALDSVIGLSQANFTVSSAGPTTLSFALTCPKGVTQAIGYTAAGKKLTLIFAPDASGVVEVDDYELP